MFKIRNEKKEKRNGNRIALHCQSVMSLNKVILGSPSHCLIVYRTKSKTPHIIHVMTKLYFAYSKLEIIFSQITL